MARLCQGQCERSRENPDQFSFVLFCVDFMKSRDSGCFAWRFCQLLSQIENLDQIRSGSITGQFVESVRKDGTKVRRRPYTLYFFKDKGGRTVSRRLSAPSQIAHYRSQIEAFREFQQCAAELVALGKALFITRI
jgi:hypothetical protein